MNKILAIGDTANNFVVLEKYLKKSKMYIINFPLKGPGKFTYERNVDFFDSLKISKQIKKINEIKNEFDLCITVSWEGARIAYLAGLNYIMYFVGDDIRKAPFNKNPLPDYLNQPIHKLNLFERKFLKNVFDNAVLCVQYGQEPSKILKQFRPDALRMDMNPVDIEIFNEKIQPINFEKKKFTFFSPQRQGLEKGIDIIWKALELCKSDFDVLQVNWYDKRTNEEEQINKKFFENLPRQVKLIPMIKREDMAKYYNFSDGVIGQMRDGMCGGIEREAAFCKKPVVNFSDNKIRYLVNGIEVKSEFMPNSKEPQDVANFIDKIVTSQKFRNEIIQKQLDFVNKISNPYECAKQWEEIFEIMIKEKKSINNNSSRIKMDFYNLLVKIFEKIIYDKKWQKKHIKNLGNDEYVRLSK